MVIVALVTRVKLRRCPADEFAGVRLGGCYHLHRPVFIGEGARRPVPSVCPLYLPQNRGPFLPCLHCTYAIASLQPW